MQGNKSEHLCWVDAVKGIGILAIMLGHIQYINPYLLNLGYMA